MTTRAARSDPLMQTALDAVEKAEREALRPGEPATFEVKGRVARSSTRPLASLDLTRLAHSLARGGTSGEATRRMEARSNSAVVVLGKYARATQVKARAYLADDGPLTLKVWRIADGEQPLGRMERRIRARVRQIAEYRAPEVLASGVAGETDYLLERVVYGQHPRTAEQRLAAGEDLLESLSRAYRKHGIEERALSEVVHESFPERIQQVVRNPHLPWRPSWGSRRRLARRLARLVRRDRAMPCSLGHGDLVSTNIIRDAQGRHVLIDWERGRFMPVAFDLNKLLLTSGRPAAFEARVEHALRPFGHDGRRHYHWREQLALGVCRRLSYLPERQKRAVEAGRKAQIDREVTELGWVVALLDR